jgi:Flp pilus assembly protein TadG
MFGRSSRNRLRGMATRFMAAEEGNIAVIFAIALLPLLSFVGAAVDYTRANAARSSMQAALDSTALMLSKDLSQGIITTSDIQTKAQAYFNALYTNKDANAISVSATYTPTSSMGANIQVNGSGNVTTDFLRVAGFPKLDFNTSSTAAWGSVRMRVAMALDNTGSMAQDGKMPAMQTAAKALVDQLSGLAKSPGDIYISVIPFAKDVNVGASNYNQSWIDWTSWENDPANDDKGTCSQSNKTTKSSCLNGGNNRTWTWDHSKWTGCVTDRDQNYDTLNTAPSGSVGLFPAEEYGFSLFNYTISYCKPGNTPYLQPIMPLSYDWSAIKTRIGNMQPTGSTNQAIGMAWAWMSLTQSAPLNAPAKDANYTYKDAIILLSDGLNTEDRWPSYGNGSVQYNGQIDARQRILCDNAKNAGITVYTIQVNTHIPADATSAVLQYCASGPENFFMVTTASQTASVFNSIGSSLSKLRVAR